MKAKWTISLLSFVASSVFQAIWQSYFASNHCQIGLRPNAEFFPFPRNAEKRRRSNSKMNYEKIKKQIVTLANTSINLTFFLRKFILIISLRHVSLRLKTKLAHGWKGGAWNGEIICLQTQLSRRLKKVAVKRSVFKVSIEDIKWFDGQTNWIQTIDWSIKTRNAVFFEVYIGFPRQWELNRQFLSQVISNQLNNSKRRQKNFRALK